jgi:peptide/nickel transport system ATP-binding protein
MKQRVLIAAALACRPRMLLADEPTTALDVTVQAGILDLLKGLNREHGLTMALVSHDLGVIAEICDDVVVMRNGEIVERGPVADVIMRPRHDYTRMLIGSQPGKLDRLTDGGVDSEAILEVDRLKVHFSEGGKLASLFGRPAGTVRAVDDISFKVASGECFGVVGESGSGKSTVARALVGLVEVTGGDIRSNGVSVVNLSGQALAEHRRHVQMIFQSPYDCLNPRMTVLDIIAEPIWRHGIAGRAAAKDRAHELMDLVELPRDLATRKPRQLSGGQCQRVGIARALGLSPRLLIADEVTSALDVTIQAQVLKLLARLRRTHDLTIIYISHDLTVVRKFCDRVAVFRNGKLVETGATEDVFGAPKEQYTRELIAAAPDLDAMTTREFAQ